tara:strand:- start:234 stop:623 length:390 start_codon:yes stop_codon:yes gene_type:complete
MQDIINAVEKEKNNRFQKSWTKLDKGSKLNRLSLFIEKECEDKDLSEDGKKKLKKLLFHVCENCSLNKANDVEYSDETYEIINIKNLIYDEDKKSYSFNLPKKVVKPTAKSKSKIDRHFSRSKGNKDKK